MLKHSICLILFALTLDFSTSNAETISSIEGNLNYLNGADAAKTKFANPGYGLQFKTGPIAEWFRPEFGAAIETASGNGGTLIGGNLSIGASLSHRVGSRVSPFIAGDGLVGWGNYSGTQANANGLLYGWMISAGAEIAIKNSESNRIALVLKSGFRVLKGSLGDVSGADLGAVVIGVGLSWTDAEGN